jgi:hypothetical protein
MSSEISQKVTCHSTVSGSGRVVRYDQQEKDEAQVQIIDSGSERGLMMGNEDSGMLVELDANACLELADGLKELAAEMKDREFGEAEAHTE